MHRNRYGCHHHEMSDYGRNPLVFNIDHAAKMNQNFRTTLWTGDYMQLTLMSIPVGSDIGVEMHENVDQFIRIESGRAKVMIGRCCGSFDEEKCVDSSYAVIIPAGTWHNIVNAGNSPLKVYSVYAPPQHHFGTVHKTQADSQRDEH